MHYRYLLTFLLSVATFTCVLPQHDAKIGFPLNAYLRQHDPSELMDLFIRGDEDGIRAALVAVGGHMKMIRPGVVSARVPVGKVRTLAASDAVDHFEFSMDRGFLLNDSMRVKNFVNEVQAGLAPLPQAYNGEGVIIGIIDSGLDHQHPDFRDENGNTRILKYWDQTLPFNAQTTPQPFGYGQVWDSTAINAGSMTSIDQPAYYGHGTTVAGTAVGNGLANGMNKGVAPKADIIVVSAAFSGDFRARVADGVKYIFDEAAALGRPVVINASLGSYLGSHDGQDAAGLFIDDMLAEQGGRVMVCAAGNSNAFADYHMQTDVGTDTTFTWFRYNSASGLGYGAVYFELWADTADFNDVRYAVGADKTSPYIYRGRTPFHSAAENVGSIITDTLVSLSGNRLGVVDLLLTPRGGQYLLQVHMQTVDSTALRYRFMTTGSGKFDVWSSAQFGTSNMVTAPPTVAQYPPIVNYVLPDRNKHMVDSWACSDRVITVANYYNEVSYIDYNGNAAVVPGVEGAIAAGSSKGPTRDERQKPDVASTGDILMSAGPLTTLSALIASEPFKVAPGGMHMRNGGTSMASPVVAGAAALYLQKCPNAPHSEVIQAIRNTARMDDFTGEVPNNHWGFGKLDVFAALLTSNIEPLPLTAPAGICAGGTIEVDVPGEFETYAWSNGGSLDPLEYAEEGPLSVVVTNASGCTGRSDTLTFELWPLPAQPLIDQVGVVLSTTAAEEFQWYLEGGPIPGATDQSYEAVVSGNYSVAVTDANGCTNTSDPLFVLVTDVEGVGAQDLAIWPIPARDELTFQLPRGFNGKVMLRVLDSNGRSVLEQGILQGPLVTVGLQGLAAGAYSVRIEQGASQMSGRFVKLP
ncbi:MAG: S8 family peptidase [Flavobacteriales bacterium]|nr:S8 family peptidase [Flavobacteriales bacterium]